MIAIKIINTIINGSIILKRVSIEAGLPVSGVQTDK